MPDPALRSLPDEQHRQRRAQSWRGGEQGIANAFTLAGKPGLLFAGGERQAFQRTGYSVK
ncbi:hypothetical protein ACNKHK_03840 [Shigella flexneri]